MHSGGRRRHRCSSASWIASAIRSRLGSVPPPPPRTTPRAIPFTSTSSASNGYWTVWLRSSSERSHTDPLPGFVQRRQRRRGADASLIPPYGVFERGVVDAHRFRRDLEEDLCQLALESAADGIGSERDEHHERFEG